jgi:hypothetical protein
MAIKEELTGKYFLNNDNVTPEMLEEIEKFNTQQSEFEMEMMINEEKKRQEMWVGKGIMPINHCVIIKPYPENPYLKKMTDDGLLLNTRAFDNPDTGMKDELDLGIPCAQVMEVSPDVKFVKPGDEILYMAQRCIPVPFMNTGFLLLNEGAVLCIINTNENLKSRFTHLKDNEDDNTSRE